MKIRTSTAGLSLARRPHARWTAVLLALACNLSMAAADPQASRLYEDALQRFEKKDFAGASVQLKNVLKADAKNLPAQVLLGKALLANGEAPAAEVAFTEALRLGVNRAEVIVPLARTLVAQARQQELVAAGNKFDGSGLPAGVRAELLLVQGAAHSDLGSAREALKAVQESRQLNPNAPESWMAEVPVQIRARRMGDAATAAQKAVALSPNSAEAAYLLGSVWHALGDVKTALASYDKALTLDGNHMEARVARMGIYMDMGRVEDVVKESAESKRLGQKDPRLSYLNSLALERKGDTKAARAGLSEVVGLLDPIPVAFLRFRPQVLMLGGLAHFGLGNYEKAKPYLEAVLRQMPEAPAAKLLGQIYLNEKNYDRAIETLDAYHKVIPADTQAVVLLATAQMGKGRSARAAQLLQDALKIEDSPRMHTFLGLALVSGGKPMDALAELEKAYRRDPNQLAAGAALIDLYLRNKQPSKAVEIAESLAKRSPKEAQYQALLGHARAASGDNARARAAFEQALKLEPNFNPVLLGLARLDVRERKLDEAGKRLATLLQRDPKNIEGLVESALLAERQGKNADAVALLTKAADHGGLNNINPALVLIDLHLRAGRTDAAKESLKALESKAPEALPILMTGARVQLASRDAKAAQGYLTRAGRLADFDPRTLVQIALLQMAAEDPKGAAYSASKALQGDPTYLPAQSMFVDASLRNGDVDAAEKAAREIATAQPKLALAHTLLGDVATARNQPSAALEAYRTAHRLEPTSGTLSRLYNLQLRTDPTGANALAENWLKTRPADQGVRGMLAAGYARTGKLPQARTLYESLVAAAPNDAEALNNLANVQLLQKDGKALATAERALALKPAAAHILGTAGWAAFQAGQVDRALQLLRDARLRDPNNADTRYFLGTVLASKGRNTEAREELKGAIAAGQALSFAKEAQEQLAALK